MQLAKLSDVYIAHVQVAEIASRSLIGFVEAKVEGSKPFGSGDTVVSATQGNAAIPRDDGKASQKEPATLAPRLR